MLFDRILHCIAVYVGFFYLYSTYPGFDKSKFFYALQSTVLFVMKFGLLLKCVALIILFLIYYSYFIQVNYKHFQVINTSN